jgi:hypothetical protein
MTKLKLALENLVVESFDTTAVAKEKGTVFGEQCSCQTICTCPGCPTCDVSCNGTCGASCNGSCDNSCGCTWVCVPETEGDTCKVYTCRWDCTDYSGCYICV